MSDSKTRLEVIATSAQVASVIVGVVIAVLSFNATRVKEAEARELEAAKPFLTLRQSLYAEALKAAGVLSNPEVHGKDELAKSRARFRELYVAELSMVEAPEVESSMRALAQQIDPDLLNLNPAQAAAYNLAHALRDSFTSAWKIKGR
ncbi:MAG: hypothetical protein HY021_05940 [Burkholderiales bacterium]|nr:hypothetical protein [Burkholderiales bacterium]